MDTLTVKGPGGVVIPSPPITMIPVRFHLYWAGSDKDGSIAGFYFAVVETTTSAPAGFPLPPLPPPKPSDYHYTTKTDSTFIFTVDELITDRLHVFYVYAVDNQGKPDPTPARFIFNSIDKFPPMPVIDEAYAEGDTVALDAYGNPSLHRGRWALTQPMHPGEPPREHVPAFSELCFRWHGEIAIPNTYISAYRYKLEEPDFVSVDSSVHSVCYGTGLPGAGSVTSGQKLFTLRAVDQAKGAGEVTRNFIVNLLPDTWWAGPDPAQFPVVKDGLPAHGVDVVKWPDQAKDRNNPQGLILGPGQSLPQGPFGGTFGHADSITYRPSMRYPANALDWPGEKSKWQKTFYEIYANRIYARTEGDTVHANSIVVLWNGGYDKDSEYGVLADTTDPQIAFQPGDSISPAKPSLTGAVIEKAGRVGSPIGFRSILVTRLTPIGLPSFPALGAIYPNYLPGSVTHSPAIGGYFRAVRAGTAYALARAQDSDGGLDSVSDALPAEESADPDVRRKVLVFYVDKAPALQTGDVDFRPNPLPNPNNPTVLDTFPDTPGSCEWNFKLRGIDLDPLDPTVANPSPGGPTTLGATRFKLTLYGQKLAGGDTSWTYIHTSGLPYVMEGNPVQLNFRPGGATGNPFATGDMYASIEICDCFQCETVPGQGRCVTGRDPQPGEGVNPNNYIHFYFKRPAGCP